MKLMRCAEELEKTTSAEAAAVEAEDFERAASLSAKADAAKAHLADLDQSMRAADAAYTQAVSSRWWIAFAYHLAAVWLVKPALGPCIRFLLSACIVQTCRLRRAS